MLTQRRRTQFCLSAAAVILLAGSALAQDPHAEKTTTTTSTTLAEPTRPHALAPDAISEGTVAVGGKNIAYKAVAGLLRVGANDLQDATIALDGTTLPDSDVEPAKPGEEPATATMFFTAYFAKDAAPNTRPIVFIYNGGPGSATMYLRMSSFGPVRVVLPDLDHPAGGPYKIVPNEDSLLDAADLVFIDAPGTGYSRVTGKDANKSFYGIDQDAGAFQRFIRRFLTKYDRWDSPRFLFGESYGTTRDAVLAAALQRHGVDLNGVVFLSQILSFDDSADGSDGNPGTDNGFFLALPSFAATAWYHHKVPNQPSELQPWLHEVEQYSLGEYASALLQGADLDATKKAAVAAKLESYTGIPAALWIKANLRLTGGEFAQDLLGGDESTGRLDSRWQGPSMNPLHSEADSDPFTESIDSAIEAAMNTYAHNTLKFGQEMTYEPSARMGGWKWDMTVKAQGGGWSGTSSNVEGEIAYTMKVNPKMHVLLMGGYFDLGTLYFGATYEMKHLPIPSSLQKNIDYKFFPTGHMVYINPEARAALHQRTAEFIRANQAGQ
jgi:carboxypeptidase C (cathepsin A)